MVKGITYALRDVGLIAGDVGLIADISRFYLPVWYNTGMCSLSFR